jgi:hypothetical protein
LAPTVGLRNTVSLLRGSAGATAPACLLEIASDAFWPIHCRKMQTIAGFAHVGAGEIRLAQL